MVETAKDPTDLVFRALASRPRPQILRMLASAGTAQGASSCSTDPHDVCACTFSEQLGLSAATVSHHMSVLRKAGLVTGHKDGLWVHYRIRLESLTTLLDIVSELCPGSTEPNLLTTEECA